ncbi:MAG: DUF4215 domain-containing protein [Gammaproteobacteria bacterium]|nr:DUF4215 domain-containing protein [Gammaproteobacteria bacterium]
MKKQTLISISVALALSLFAAQSAYASCGNGILTVPDEQCDDGNNVDGDGCSATCTIEPMCGDGIVNAGEACDDGNNMNGDGCSSSCTIEAYCGDGILNDGEMCDDGNNVDSDGCSSECTIEPFCGDGNLDAGEMCDDGNSANGDGCSALCEVEKTGDQGCTPGYWKQTQHFDSWAAPYTPSTQFSAVFEDAFPGKSLLQVMKTGGGGLNALGRHTVAALLNAASADVNYGQTTGGVIDAFNSVYPGTKAAYTSVKDDFAEDNESGCPLN